MKALPFDGADDVLLRESYHAQPSHQFNLLPGKLNINPQFPWGADL